MNDVVVSRNPSGNTFLVNNEIEEVLSAGSADNLKIQKMSENNRTQINKIQDKIELSSNKDIDIGLELLVNRDKMVKKNDNEAETHLQPIDLNNSNLEEVNNVVNLDKNDNMDEITFGDPTADLVNQLNIDDRTSRLSQDAIDAIIDKNDNEAKPNLVDINDLPDEQNNSSPLIDRGIFAPDLESSVQPPVDDYDESHANGERSSQHYNDRDVRSHHQRSQYDDYYRREPPRKTAEEIAQEKNAKEEILWQLEKYRRLGVQGVKKFNMSSELAEMESEFTKIKKQRELEGSVKFQRKCLVAFATGTELLNNKLDMLDFKLDGWSEQVNEGIDEYNEVFEELHEKYKEKAKIAPELKLLFMMGGSAFMYHITNSMFKNSVPGMEDIMRQNPDLMKQFANAAINQMDGEKKSAAKFFNNFAPGQQPQYEQPMGGQRPMPDIPSSRNPMRQSSNPAPFARNIPQQSRPAPAYTNMNGEGTVADVTSDSSAFNRGTRQISAPVGVDDILKELKSNTDDLQSNDNISEVISRTSKRSSTRNININSRKKPPRSINLNLGGV